MLVDGKAAFVYRPPLAVPPKESAYIELTCCGVYVDNLKKELDGHPVTQEDLDFIKKTNEEAKQYLDSLWEPIIKRLKR